MARPAKIALNPEGHHVQSVSRFSIRGLIALQSWMALVIVVFLGHWGWGVFLLAMYLSGIAFLVTLRSRGALRMLAGLLFLATLLMLYPLSLGPCRNTLRIFEMSTRVKLVNALGSLYFPLSKVYQPDSGLDCLCDRDSIESGLCGAYHYYIESFE